MSGRSRQALRIRSVAICRLRSLHGGTKQGAQHCPQSSGYTGKQIENQQDQLSPECQITIQADGLVAALAIAKREAARAPHSPMVGSVLRVLRGRPPRGSTKASRLGHKKI